MNKPFAAYYLLIIALMPVTTWLRSQDIPASTVPERLEVCTDRTMYISGENILFSAIIFSNNDYSHILYCELIAPGGNRISGGKYQAENSSFQGCLQIPEETITGIYYLKSYTRFMRNGSPESYHYIMLKIINPYRAEVLTAYEAEDTVFPAGEKTGGPLSDMPLSISLEKKIYAPREGIRFTVSGNRSKDLPLKLCLAVIPELVYAESPGRVKTADPSYNNLQFYPETRGISLSGELLEKETGLPIPNALVNLSIIGDKDAMAIRTDSAGRYFFALPGYEGNRDIFLCSENITGKSPEIFIDNDFCPLPVNLQPPAFHLTEKEVKTAYRLAVNQKVSSIFTKDTVSGKQMPQQNGKPFYGEPTQVLVMENYIDLPTLEEYFNELPFGVDVRKSQGIRHFRFYTTRTEMTIYDPLVLVDWVAVSDIERVLAMSPAGIDRIELVNAPYVKGNITYGGIISFISKKNDFAGIDLPGSGTFINYKFLAECPENIPAGTVPASFPDARNTVYWDPDIRTGEKGSAEISFTTPDTPGKYIILLRGMNPGKEEVSIRQEFEVSEE